METKRQEDKVEKLIPEYNDGTLKSGKDAGKRLTRQQSVSLRLNEAVMRRKANQ